MKPFFTHIKLHRYVKSNCIPRSKEVSEEKMCQAEFLERYAKRLREHREVDSRKAKKIEQNRWEEVEKKTVRKKEKNSFSDKDDSAIFTISLKCFFLTKKINIKIIRKKNKYIQGF